MTNSVYTRQKILTSAILTNIKVTVYREESFFRRRKMFAAAKIHGRQKRDKCGTTLKNSIFYMERSMVVQKLEKNNPDKFTTNTTS